MKKLLLAFALTAAPALAQGPSYPAPFVQTLCQPVMGGPWLPCAGASGNDPNAVLITGNQTIDGIKTFLQPVTSPNFVGAMNGVTISGTPQPGGVPVAVDATHATWGNNSPSGTGFWFSSDGVRDSEVHTIQPQDLPAIISSDTTGRSGTTGAFDHTPISCQPVAGITQYQTGTDAQGNSTGCSSPTGSGQPGSVTTITVDDIPGIADTTVTNASTTPHVSYTLLGAPAHGFWGNNSDTEGGTVGYSNIVVSDLPEEIAGTQAHNTFWAAPDSTNGIPSFRALVPNDITGLPASTSIFSGTTVVGSIGYSSNSDNIVLSAATGHGIDFLANGGTRYATIDTAGNLHYGTNLPTFVDANRNIFATSVTAATFTGHLVGNADSATLATNATNATNANTSTNLTGSINVTQVTGLAAALALLAPLNAPSFTGQPTLPNGTFVNGAMVFNGSGAVFRGSTIYYNGQLRWNIGSDNGDTGSNNGGSDLRIYRYSDAGTLLGMALNITRATGLAAFAVRPTFNGFVPWDSNNFNPALFLTIANAQATYLALTGGTLSGSLTVHGGVTASEISSPYYTTQVRTITTADTVPLGSGDTTLYCDATAAAITEPIQGPSKNELGQLLIVSKKDATANACTLTGAANISGTSTINGATTLALTQQNEAVILQWVAGGNWLVVSHTFPSQTPFITGRITVASGTAVGAVTPSVITQNSNCIASPLTPLGTPGANVFQYTVHVSPSDVSIVLPSNLAADQTYMYICKP